MMLYIPHYVHDRVKHGGSMRVASLISFLRTVPGSRIFVPSRRCFDYLTGLVLILGRIFFDKNRLVLFSYPNFPFFGNNFVNHFFLLVFLKGAKGLASRQNKKLILDVDDLPSYYGRSRPSARLKNMERTLFESMDYIWVITLEEAEVMQKMHGLDPNKFVVVPNGDPRLDMPAKYERNGTVRFVYAGSFFWKGVREMLDSFIRLKTVKKVELWLLGAFSGWIKDYLRDQPDPRIRFLGELDYQECEAVVKSCDIGLLPYSPKERYYHIAHPVKLSLYIVSLLPTIAFNVKALSQVIREKEVGLISSFPSMTDTMRRLAEDDTLRESLAKNCARVREDFYWDSIYRRAVAETLKKASFTSS